MEICDSRQEKIIYKAYKEFYGKEPNFDKENMMNITIEIQSMVFILQEYGVNLGCESFARGAYKNLELPMDMKIQDIIVGRLLEGDMNLVDDSLQFNECAEKYIDVIGKVIRNVVDNSENPVETLRILTYILYIKKYVCPSASDELVKELANCKEIDLENENRLINAIRTELCKDNFNEKNMDNLKKMINVSQPNSVYRMIVNETGNGITPNISEESKKIAVKALLR